MMMGKKGDFGRWIRLWTQFSLLTLILHASSIRAGENSTVTLISLSPHITEMVYKLDAGRQLIGRTDFCRYPPAAENVESIGGYLNIDFEKIVRLAPHLVLQFPNLENRHKLESLGLRVEDLPNETVDEILTSIRRLGDLLDLPEKAAKLCANIQDTLKLVREWSREILQPVPAILVIGRDRGSLANLYLAGQSTYLSEIWGICGGSNAFSEIPLRYFSINEEDLIKKPVDFILEFHPGWMIDSEQMTLELKVWKLFKSIKAVREGQIFIFTERFYVIPGPRITQIAIQFAEIIKNKKE